MTCANPACGHPEGDHHQGRHDLEPQECMVGMFGESTPPCRCNRFVPPREPLMVQIEALIESRTKLPK